VGKLAAEGELEADEKAMFDAMAAFKAGAVPESHVRDVARRLMKMSSGGNGQRDELGQVVDTPEGIVITPSLGVDRYLVVPPERPDAAGKVGLMLLEPLGGVGSTFEVYERPQASAGSVSVGDIPPTTASGEYSVDAGVEGRVAALECRLVEINSEYVECVSRGGRSALVSERREIENELLQLRSRERTTV
jgi:hypothetical protein